MEKVVELDSPKRLIFSKSDRESLAALLQEWADSLRDDAPIPIHGIAIAAYNTEGKEIFTDWWRGPSLSHIHLIGCVDILHAQMVDRHKQDS